MSTKKKMAARKAENHYERSLKAVDAMLSNPKNKKFLKDLFQKIDRLPGGTSSYPRKRLTTWVRLFYFPVFY